MEKSITYVRVYNITNALAMLSIIFYLKQTDKATQDEWAREGETFGKRQWKKTMLETKERKMRVREISVAE